MLDKQHGKTVFICDNCGDGTQEFNNYNEGQSYIKNEGWQTKYINGERTHYCPDCRECAEI